MLWLFGVLQVTNKLVFIFSLILNKGILHTRNPSQTSLFYRVVAGDSELLYHWLYLGLCFLGWIVHEFLYSFLVRFYRISSLLKGYYSC